MNNDPLNLRNLPVPRRPDGLWPAIEAVLDDDATNAAARRRRRRYLATAVAASLVVAVTAVQFFDARDRGAAVSATANPELQQARAASARLERLLRNQRDGLLDAAAIESLAWMEQELGWLDVQLADRPSDIGLWQQRTDLLAEMSSQYQRNNWQTQLRLASY